MATTDAGQWRRGIEQFVCSTEGFSGDYKDNDTQALLAEFNAKVSSGATTMLVLASRHYSNLNLLTAAHQDAKVTTVVRDWRGRSHSVIQKDPEKVQQLKNTFNGPALIPHLLPPSNYLSRRKNHPALQNDNTLAQAWKDVAGKIEAVSNELPACFKVSEYDLIKAKDIRNNEKEREEYIKDFVQSTFASFEGTKCYPGGSKELYQRAFSLYRVDVRRSGDKVHGYKVQWYDDYTHKPNEDIWSFKGYRSTIGIEDYNVYVHDDGATFAAWDSNGSDPIRAQVAAYLKTLSE